MFVGLVTAWRLATVPTRRSPLCVKATTDGVVRPPSLFSITVGSPPSRTAMHEFVVPRSIPMVFAMCCAPLQDLSLLGADCSRSGTSAAARIRHIPGAVHGTSGGRGGAGSRGTRAPGPRGVSSSIVSCSSSNGALLAEQAEPGADAGDVRVDGHVALAVGEQQHAGGGLAADAGERDQLGAALPRRSASREARRGRRSSSSRRIAWIRTDLTFEMPPGRIASLDLGVGRVAHGRPSCRSARAARRKATSRLRSLVDCERTVRISSSRPVPVRRGERPAVDARAGGRGCGGRGRGWASGTARTVAVTRWLTALPRSGEISASCGMISDRSGRLSCDIRPRCV